jgi:hypothetical protein
MKDLNLQASPVMARSNATKPSRNPVRCDWIARAGHRARVRATRWLALAMTEVTGNTVSSPLGGEV